METLLLNRFLRILKDIEYVNLMSPFPLYDSEIVNDLHKIIKKLKEIDNKYDNLPVVACKYCNDLNIKYDDLDNEICMRCGSVNETEEYENIYEYKKITGK